MMQAAMPVLSMALPGSDIFAAMEAAAGKKKAAAQLPFSRSRTRYLAT
jgi:hypothetical protein